MRVPAALILTQLILVLLVRSRKGCLVAALPWARENLEWCEVRLKNLCSILHWLEIRILIRLYQRPTTTATEAWWNIVDPLVISRQSSQQQGRKSIILVTMTPILRWWEIENIPYQLPMVNSWPILKFNPQWIGLEANTIRLEGPRNQKYRSCRYPWRIWSPPLPTKKHLDSKATHRQQISSILSILSVPRNFQNSQFQEKRKRLLSLKLSRRNRSLFKDRITTVKFSIGKSCYRPGEECSWSLKDKQFPARFSTNIKSPKHAHQVLESMIQMPGKLHRLYA